MKKLLIIDAHALIHRGFHALPPLTDNNGQQINAVYGFFLILLRVIKDLKPEYLAVTFDSKGKTFRNDLYAEYKANRPPAPDELKSQFPIVHELVDAFGWASYSVPEYEADDLIGTICHQFDGKGKIETIILSGDHDLLQLVDDDTRMMKLHKGVKETIFYDPAMVKEKHGLEPKQIIDYKGLRGDSSDNIPGVKGIGEKGATSLLQEYGSIEEVFKNLDNITGREKKALEGSEKDALLSKKLATIVLDAPIDFKLEDAKTGSYDRDAVIKKFQKYGFKNLLTQLNSLPGFELKEGLFAPKGEDAKKERDPNLKYTLVQTPEDIKKLATELQKQKIFAFDTETTGLKALEDDLVGISFSWKESEGWYVACGTNVPAEIKVIMEDPSIGKTAHNMKFDRKVMHHAGVEVQGEMFDSMIASFLLSGGSRGNGLDHLAFTEFGHEMQPITELIGKNGKNQITMAEVPVEDASWYAAEDADFTWRLYTTFKSALEEKNLNELMNTFEIPTMKTLTKMEITGIGIDVPFLNTMSKELHQRIEKLEKEIHATAGMEFNIASPAQLKEVLFDKLGLPTDKIKKTKTGYSTAASELDKLRSAHPIIDMMTEFRELAKLTSTYIDTLPKLMNPQTKRIHTSYSQTIAATGRLSSFDPNLQNIPIRTELGREIRKAFIPAKGKKILALDYSQIELRVVAHLANDPVMKESFLNGEDIHTRTAAELNDVSIEEVTKDMRRQAKTINFGVLYGMGVQGIMRDSGISKEEARMFLDKYFSVHKGIADYIEQIKENAKKDEYAETLFGRRRYLPEINSSNRMISAGAERAAVNMPVQGTAADLMKLAMIEVQQHIDSEKIDATMLLQVHDELVLEVDTDKVESEAKKIKAIMEKVHKLDVPLIVDVEAGDNWGELERILT